MKHACILLMLGTGWLVAQDLPPGLPPEIANPKGAVPAPVAAPVTPVPTPAAIPVPAPKPAPAQPVNLVVTGSFPSVPPVKDVVAIPARIPPEYYQTLWQRSPFELSIQSANAAPTGIAADWLLTSLSRVDGQPMAILFNRTTNETAVVKTKDNGTHGMRLLSAEIMPDYHKSKVMVTRGAEKAELVFQEQDLSTLAGAVSSNAVTNMPVPNAQPGISIPRLPGSTSVPNAQPGQSGANTSTSTPRPPRRVIMRPKPVTPPNTP